MYVDMTEAGTPGTGLEQQTGGGGWGGGGKTLRFGAWHRRGRDRPGRPPGRLDNNGEAVGYYERLMLPPGSQRVLQVPGGRPVDGGVLHTCATRPIPRRWHRAADPRQGDRCHRRRAGSGLEVAPRGPPRERRRLRLTVWNRSPPPLQPAGRPSWGKRSRTCTAARAVEFRFGDSALEWRPRRAGSPRC